MDNTPDYSKERERKTNHCDDDTACSFREEGNACPLQQQQGEYQSPASLSPKPIEKKGIWAPSVTTTTADTRPSSGRNSSRSVRETTQAQRSSRINRQFQCRTKKKKKAVRDISCRGSLPRYPGGMEQVALSGTHTNDAELRFHHARVSTWPKVY